MGVEEANGDICDVALSDIGKVVKVNGEEELEGCF